MEQACFPWCLGANAHNY